MKRWNPRPQGAFMDRTRDGLYVSYEDYEALRTALTECGDVADGWDDDQKRHAIQGIVGDALTT